MSNAVLNVVAYLIEDGCVSVANVRLTPPSSLIYFVLSSDPTAPGIPTPSGVFVAF